MTVRVQCHAKINLLLKVGQKRPDGFHDLISVMQSIDLTDFLEFTETASGGIQIECNRPEVPTDKSNIVWKAVELMAKEFERDIPGLKIRIEKSIPVMGGLAGGSADAAGTLMALRNLWNLEVDESVLLRLGAKLGSDVPFCLVGGTSLVQGRGEVLEPLPMGIADLTPDPGAFLVVAPEAKVETKWAYDLLDSYREKEKILSPWGDDREAYLQIQETWLQAIFERNFPSFFYNDFEEPVLSARPELAKVYNNFRNAAGHVLLSGSGSCMFAYFHRYSDALDALERYNPVDGEIALIALPSSKGIIIE